MQAQQQWIPLQKHQKDENGFQNVAGPFITHQHIHGPVVLENAFAALQDTEIVELEKDEVFENGIHGE